MDAFGHVNNAVYFTYYETARIEYFKKLEFEQANNFGPIVAEVSSTFKKPLTYPDTLRIGATIESLDTDRFTMLYHLYSQEHDDIAAEGDALVVCYDYVESHPIDIPESLLEKINSLEDGTVSSP